MESLVIFSIFIGCIYFFIGEKENVVCEGKRD